MTQKQLVNILSLEEAERKKGNAGSNRFVLAWKSVEKVLS